MKETLTVTANTFNRLLLSRDHKYTIPLFQRSYCWGQRELDMLFEDIYALYPKTSDDEEDPETRFLGAIILKRAFGGDGDNVETFDIIDGQQRVLTIYTFLAITCGIANDAASKILSNDNSSDTEKEKAEDLEKRCRSSAKGMIIQRGDDENRSKVFPSFNDRLEFDDVLELLSFLPSKPEAFELSGEEVKGDLEAAIKIIRTGINERLAARLDGLSGEERQLERCKYFRQVLDIVINRLEFIEVILAERHDPNQVFDRLNVQGQELTVLDLVRNEIFRVFGTDDKAASKFYNSQWLKFEDALISPIKSSMNPEKMDAYRAKQREHKQNFWHPYALTKDPDVRADSKSVFHSLKALWAKLDGTALSRARQIVNDLQDYVPIYNAITEGEKSSPLGDNPELWRRIMRLHEYGIQKGTYGYVFQLLLWASTHPENHDEVCRCLDLLDSYLMRRSLMNDDRSVKNVFNPAWRIANYNPLRLQYQLDDRSRPFHSNTEVENKVTSESANFYSLGRRARYFMAEYERSKPGDPYQPLEPQLDHIMPQKPQDNWPEIDPVDHEQYVNSLGNIVLLTHITNRIKSNKSWADAKIEYKKSRTHEANRLAELDSWDIDAIKARTSELLSWALDRWKKPNLEEADLINKEFQAELLRDKERAKKLFEKHGLAAGFIRKTQTGMTHSNVNADKEMREFLVTNDIHDYDTQEAGEKNKVQKTAYFYLWKKDLEETKLSFNVRKKDSGQLEKRLWPLRSNGYAGKWTVIAVCKVGGSIMLVNCSNPMIRDNFLETHGTEPS